MTPSWGQCEWNANVNAEPNNSIGLFTDAYATPSLILGDFVRSLGALVFEKHVSYQQLPSLACAQSSAYASVLRTLVVNVMNCNFPYVIA